MLFLTMYFVLPEYTPPRPLGEAGVRKHWSTKYTGFTIYSTVWYIITDTLIWTFFFTPPAPCLGQGFD
jgi:hypothetical protein